MIIIHLLTKKLNKESAETPDRHIRNKYNSCFPMKTFRLRKIALLTVGVNGVGAEGIKAEADFSAALASCKKYSNLNIQRKFYICLHGFNLSTLSAFTLNLCPLDLNLL